MDVKTVSVVGLGYIGLPSAILIANNGFKVLGYDINKDVVENIKNLNIAENEPNLKKLTKKALKNKSLEVSNKLLSSDIYLICVPTPIKKKSGKVYPDTDYVFQAIDEIKKIIKPNDSVIIESTCPPGTTDLAFKRIGLNNKITMAYCPERILPGNLIQELIYNDRIVGGVNNKSSKIIGKFYKNFCKGEINYCNSLTAEIVKLAENSFRDINIAYANSLSLIADKLNISALEIIKLANKHPRVKILDPGIGVGGHCIPVDPWFLIDTFPKETNLLSEARNINDKKVSFTYKKIKDQICKFQHLHKKTPSILCLGLSYKENSDDMRESPANKIYMMLKQKGFNVCGFEPNLLQSNFKQSNIELLIQKYDIIVKLVNHKKLKNITKNSIPKNKVFVDLLN